MRFSTKFIVAAVLVSSSLAGSALADPWADAVVDYTPGADVPRVFGSDPPVFFDRADSALGAPTRDTAGGDPISPIRPAATPDEVVSLGFGGELTVRFDEPVTNHPANPFGIDLLVFGNAQFFNLSVFPLEPSTPLTGIFAEPGLVSVSSDGTTFIPVTGAEADALFPTAGYRDVDGVTPADFTLPVDPALSPLGLTEAQLLAAYNGSGGGLGIDIGALGLEQISYVRISNPAGSGVTPEIDAFADVRPAPEPGTLSLLLMAVCWGRLRRPRV